MLCGRKEFLVSFCRVALQSQKKCIVFLILIVRKAKARYVFQFCTAYEQIFIFGRVVVLHISISTLCKITKYQNLVSACCVCDKMATAVDLIFFQYFSLKTKIQIIQNQIQFVSIFKISQNLHQFLYFQFLYYKYQNLNIFSFCYFYSTFKSISNSNSFFQERNQSNLFNQISKQENISRTVKNKNFETK